MSVFALLALQKVASACMAELSFDAWIESKDAQRARSASAAAEKRQKAAERREARDENSAAAFQLWRVQKAVVDKAIGLLPQLTPRASTSADWTAVATSLCFVQLQAEAEETAAGGAGGSSGAGSGSFSDARKPPHSALAKEFLVWSRKHRALEEAPVPAELMPKFSTSAISGMEPVTAAAATAAASNTAAEATPPTHALVNLRYQPVAPSKPPLGTASNSAAAAAAAATASDDALFNKVFDKAVRRTWSECMEKARAQLCSAADAAATESPAAAASPSAGSAAAAVRHRLCMRNGLMWLLSAAAQVREAASKKAAKDV